MAQRGKGAGSNGSSGRLSGREVIARVRRELPELMGQPIESVLGLERDDGGWSVTVQVVELARIPHSTDVLGAYAVTVDSEGELIGWRRKRRYHRNQADED
jgi:Gas vesicle synthesis protein GvpO